jgi:aminopeptidase YwaD
MSRLDYHVDDTPFESLDHVCHSAELTHGDESFTIHSSPYTLGCDVQAELVAVSTIGELEASDCEGKLLLLRGDLCSEQLMPKNFVFYNPEHHQRIIGLLESQNPAAIVTATERNPEQVGALYPFPLIVDGDFDLPSVYCRDTTGDRLAALEGSTVRLTIDASRLPSQASNVIARLNEQAPEKIVITAHIDAYEDSPGASDNASGTAVLLLCAEMLAGYRGRHGLEIAALNGEDHYSAGGQMDYLKRHVEAFPSILLAVNIDDVGYREGKSHYSFYDCAPQLTDKAMSVFQHYAGLARGAQWFNGDHMIFVQHGVPSVAFTSECMPELMKTVSHTALDTPENLDRHKLCELAASLGALVRSL